MRLVGSWKGHVMIGYCGCDGGKFLTLWLENTAMMLRYLVYLGGLKFSKIT